MVSKNNTKTTAGDGDGDGGKGVLEYELSREQRIKENLLRMQKLGIVELSRNLKPTVAKPKPKPKPQKPAVTSADGEPRRSSSSYSNTPFPPSPSPSPAVVFVLFLLTILDRVVVGMREIISGFVLIDEMKWREIAFGIWWECFILGI
nr:hypothetical protein [Tanacetum cinerariifolium]